MAIREIHGYPILAWAQTERQSGEPCGIVLVQTKQAQRDVPAGLGTPEFVTAWYRLGDHEWSHGNYFASEKAMECAWNDFIRRINLAGGVK